MTGIAWTDKRTEQLKALWRGGLSAADIAAELGGVSRNAVIGKAGRLGLVHTERSSVPKPKAHAAPKPKRTWEFIVPAKSKPKRTVVAVAPPAALPVVSPTAGAGTVTLMNLERHHCRWPMDVDFCGAAAIEGKSYCAYHLRISRRAS